MSQFYYRLYASLSSVFSFLRLGKDRNDSLNCFITAQEYQREIIFSIAGTECVITGWGRTSQGGKLSSVLREAKVPIVSEGECRMNYGRDGLITSNMLCAGFRSQGKDACQGDSGGK